MISICIPIYNKTVTKLVNELHRQSAEQSINVEIILIDDCSQKAFKDKNQLVCEKQTYIELSQNIGRSAIRNLFLKHSNYDYLLYLDCDAYIHKKDFLAKYIHLIQNNSPAIACGGREFPSTKPVRGKRLRWKYGRNVESISAENRSLKPNKSFMTNNFLIKKELFNSVKFDERLRDYGHEDTLFGFELKKQNISIIHLNNPILNGDLEDDNDFIKNSEKAIFNLIKILNFKKNDANFTHEVKLLKVYDKLERYKLILLSIFELLTPLSKYLLAKGFSSLKMFAFFKIGTLTLAMQKQKQFD